MTKRQEASEFLTNALQAAKDPAVANVLTYLSIKNTDWAGAEEAEKMLKKMLPPGIAEPEDGEQEPPPMVQTPQGPIPADQAGQLIAQLMQQVEQGEATVKKAGDLKDIEHQVATKASDVSAQEQALDAKREEIAAAERELKLQADLERQRLENERLRAEEGLRQQAEAHNKEAQARQEASEPQGADDSLAPIAEGMNAMAQAVAQQSEVLAKLVQESGKPRKKTPIRDQNGDILHVVEEAMEPTLQ
jgi:hypothetical protein